MTVLKGEIAVKQSIALIKAFKEMKDYISNNIDRFPEEFMFKLTTLEAVEISRCKNFTAIIQLEGTKEEELPYLALSRNKISIC